MMMRLGALCVAVLCGCEGVRSLETSAVRPAIQQHWKQIVLAHYRETLFDPYSVRDALVADPFWSAGIIDSGWAICSRFNAKNRMGAYTGIETRAVLLMPTRIVPTDPSGICYDNPTYRPFPEMEEKPRPS